MLLENLGPPADVGRVSSKVNWATVFKKRDMTLEEFQDVGHRALDI